MRTARSDKRDLAGHGLTPAESRTECVLPVYYPMMSPACARKRDEPARDMGLDRWPGDVDAGSASSEPRPAWSPLRVEGIGSCFARGTARLRRLGPIESRAAVLDRAN
ncbi:MucR family transcriptional regulator [Lichenibacterium dinghuense]|uniref:MucR family transcriptional regulator n=1 Tax=Lichenibacterium dinghuense TaxID=2895977 RepID=UPI003D165748